MKIHDVYDTLDWVGRMLEQTVFTFLVSQIVRNNLLYGYFFKVFVNDGGVIFIIFSFFVSTRLCRQGFSLIVLSYHLLLDWWLFGSGLFLFTWMPLVMLVFQIYFPWRWFMHWSSRVLLLDQLSSRRSLRLGLMLYLQSMSAIIGSLFLFCLLKTRKYSLILLFVIKI